MTVSIVTRWITPNVEASTNAARQAKAVWMKHGASDFRLNQVFTGPLTGQWLVRVSFADMQAYAKAQAAVSASAEMQKVQAANTKAGAMLQERMILVETDL
ncbi:MAG: hypothetical protein AB7I59_20875 [Geminicoccaceae bacterium]